MADKKKKPTKKKKFAPKKKAAKPVAKKAKKAADKPKPIPVQEYQAQLEKTREDLARIVQRKREEAIPETEVGDEGDVAARSLERDLVFEQTGTERRLLEAVEAALRRIEKGTFGTCDACNVQIGALRLKAIPYARYCINCQSRFESA